MERGVGLRQREGREEGLEGRLLEALALVPAQQRKGDRQIRSRWRKTSSAESEKSVARLRTPDCASLRAEKYPLMESVHGYN